MTREEFMKRAEDAAYLGDTSALRGYVGEVFDELERLREELEALKYPRAYIPPGDERARALSALMLSQAETEIRTLKAEVEVLRGVGCREAKLDEPESGPCGVCLRCAEEQGAKWALEIALDPSRWPVSKWTPEEVCRDARGKR